MYKTAWICNNKNLNLKQKETNIETAIKDV